MITSLSPRQTQIVILKCRDDLTNDQVGAALRISPQTVKNHVTIILRSLGVRSMNAVCWRCARADGIEGR